MDKEKIALDALTSKDHQAALAIIYWLEHCHTREEFNQVLEVAVMPLLNCSGAFYMSLANKKIPLQLLGSINRSHLCQHRWGNFLIMAMQSQAVVSRVSGSMTSWLATDTFSCCDLSCTCCSSDKLCCQVNSCCTLMALFDVPRHAIALCFCRLNAQEKRYSQRDIELLKLLRPTLLQTVKAILFQEQNKNQRQITDRRSGHIEPLAVVSEAGVLVYKNSIFDQTVKKRNGTFLTSVFSQANSVKLRKTESYCLLSQLGNRIYEITLMLLNEGTNESARLYLLRFSRISNITEKVINQLSRAGLTKRELEIAKLIHQGTTARDISEDINLSYHTVRNHIKSIYGKLGVTTRSEMLVWVG